MPSPAMKDLGPAFARIARVEAQTQALYDKREAEFRRIRKEGVRILRIAIKRAGLVRGETIIAHRKWVIGVYAGTELNWCPSGPSKEWSFIVYGCSIRKDGRLGQRQERQGVFAQHPGDAFKDIRIVGKMVDGKAMWNA